MFSRVKNVTTHNLPHTVLNVVRSNVMARNSGADDNHFLPGVILRVRKISGVDDLALEAFLSFRSGYEL